MANVTSTVKLGIQLSGALNGIQAAPTISNPNGSGDVDLKTLAIGDNVITVPTGGSTPQGVIIIPPAGNSGAIKLKGASGDVGIQLHNVESSYISLAPTQSSFIINVDSIITGIRFIWN